MAYLNKVMLIGNIGHDPRTNTSPDGRKRVSFSLATSRRYRDNNGEQKEQTSWHIIVIWGKAADTFEQLGLGKGVQLFIEGELVNRSWTDNQGSKRSITEVNASTFQILSPRGQNASQGGSAGVSAQGSASGMMPIPIRNFARPEPTFSKRPLPIITGESAATKCPRNGPA